MKVRFAALNFAVLLAALSMTLVGAPARAADPPAIAAASDLSFALTEVAAQFTKDTGKSVKLTFGSSGNFTTQIQQGAPFEVFLSADEAYVQTLARAGKTDGAGALYAIGRIVVFTPTGSPVRADSGLKDLRAALTDGRLKSLAIANPAHAPYGRAAREALQHANAWEVAQTRLVLGENASQAAQFATSGSSQGGIMPYSIAIAPAVAKLGTSALIPAGWHKPLRQRMVLVKGAGDTARAFYAYLQGGRARGILRRYGFTLPAGTS